MTKNITFSIALLLVAASTAMGCELIASVDRSKIEGGAGGGTSTATGTGGMATTTSTTSGGGMGGMMCAGGAAACGTEADCPDPMNECVTRTCTAGCCGTSDVADGMTTTAGQTAGDCKKQVCDGKGATKSVDDADPPDDTNACTADTCNLGVAVHTEIAGPCMLAGNAAVCGNPAGANKGTCVACNVNADCVVGKVCDTITNPALPACVDMSCMNGIKDGTETGTDCGGTCSGCPNAGPCTGNGDCASGFCSSLVCTACAADANCTSGNFCKAGVCTVKDAAGVACGGNNECASGVCGIAGSGNCCASACTTGGTCGATSCAAGTGACVYPSAAIPCGPAPSCAAGIQTNASACSGAGLCTSGGTTPCGLYTCNAGGTACNTACTVDGECSAGNYCNGSACVAKKVPGVACAKNSACVSGVCDISGAGNCCTAACVTGGTCGATSCAAGTGACVYPSAATACGAGQSCTGNTLNLAQACNGAGACPAAGTTNCAATGKVCNAALGCVSCNTTADCPATGNECVVPTCNGNMCGTSNLGNAHVLSTGQTAGDCQKIVCNGAGSTTSIDDPTDLPTSNTVCQTSPACTGAPLAPSFTSAAPNTDCTADNQSPKHVCGSGVFAGTCVQCNSLSDCAFLPGAVACNAVHVCQ